MGSVMGLFGARHVMATEQEPWRTVSKQVHVSETCFFSGVFASHFETWQGSIDRPTRRLPFCAMDRSREKGKHDSHHIPEATNGTAIYMPGLH